MTADPYKTGRRLGRWDITRTFAEDNYAAMMFLQTRVLILDANYDWLIDRCAYRGQSPEFDIVELGATIPLYVPVFTVYSRTKSGPLKIADMRWARATGECDSAVVDYTGWYPEKSYHFPSLEYLPRVAT